MKNPAEIGVSAGFFNVCAGGRLADLNGGFHADLDGLLVHRDEVVVTGREGLFQSGCFSPAVTFSILTMGLTFRKAPRTIML